MKRQNSPDVLKRFPGGEDDVLTAPEPSTENGSTTENPGSVAGDEDQD